MDRHLYEDGFAMLFEDGFTMLLETAGDEWVEQPEDTGTWTEQPSGA